MNVLQNFVWGNKRNNLNIIKNIDIEDFVVLKDVYGIGGGYETFYLKKIEHIINSDLLYRYINVIIQKPTITTFQDDCYVGQASSEDNVYIFVECIDEITNKIQILKFPILKKTGKIQLELPQSKKITKIYSVVGAIFASAGEGAEQCNYIASAGATYDTDALVSYELIQYKIVDYPLEYDSFVFIAVSREYITDLYDDRREHLYLNLNSDKTKYTTNLSTHLSCSDLGNNGIGFYDNQMKLSILGDIIYAGLDNSVIPSNSFTGFDTISFKKLDGTGWTEFPLDSYDFGFKNKVQKGLHYLTNDVFNGFTDDGYGNYHAEYRFEDLEFKLLNKQEGTSTLPIHIRDISFAGSCYIPRND